MGRNPLRRMSGSEGPWQAAEALEVLRALDRGFLGHGQHPAGGLTGGLAEEKFADLLHVAVVFVDPVEARDAGIEVAQLDIAADLLRADQADLQFLLKNKRLFSLMPENLLANK